MEKILITGSNGLLGQKLVYSLRNRANIEVIAASKGLNRVSEKTGYTYYELDITNKTEIQTLLTTLQPEVIINTAAMTNVEIGRAHV